MRRLVYGSNIGAAAVEYAKWLVEEHGIQADGLAWKPSCGDKSSDGTPMMLTSAHNARRSVMQPQQNGCFT